MPPGDTLGILLGGNIENVDFLDKIPNWRNLLQNRYLECILIR